MSVFLGWFWCFKLIECLCLLQLCRKLVEPPYIDSIDWSKWHVFWVDERVVPKDHPDSNYLLAYDAFLSKVFLSFYYILILPPQCVKSSFFFVKTIFRSMYMLLSFVWPINGREMIGLLCNCFLTFVQRAVLIVWVSTQRM